MNLLRMLREMILNAFNIDAMINNAAEKEAEKQLESLRKRDSDRLRFERGMHNMIDDQKRIARMEARIDQATRDAMEKAQNKVN
jgi:hypothetical protein